MILFVKACEKAFGKNGRLDTSDVGFWDSTIKHNVVPGSSKDSYHKIGGDAGGYAEILFSRSSKAFINGPQAFHFRIPNTIKKAIKVQRKIPGFGVIQLSIQLPSANVKLKKADEKNMTLGIIILLLKYKQLML